jgi:pentatricopeptide repeat protein
MGKEGIRADTVTWNPLIHGLFKDARVKEAAQLFTEMVATQVMPDNVT